MTHVLTMTVALQEDEAGGLRIADTRIPLERVIYAYQDGQAPEAIVGSFPALKLADVYAVIGYYLDHQDEVTAYLERREQEAADLRQDVESRFPTHELRGRLAAARHRTHEE